MYSTEVSHLAPEVNSRHSCGRPKIISIIVSVRVAASSHVWTWKEQLTLVGSGGTYPLSPTPLPGALSYVTHDPDLHPLSPGLRCGARTPKVGSCLNSSSNPTTKQP